MKDAKHVTQRRVVTRGADGRTVTQTDTVTRVADDTPRPADATAQRRPVPWYAWAIVAALAGVWLAIATHCG